MTSIDWERSLTTTLYYDDCSGDSLAAMKPLVTSTVDQTQIMDLAQQSQHVGRYSWFCAEIAAAGMTTETAEDGRRNNSTALSQSSPAAGKPVVPVVVEDKEAEDDGVEVNVRPTPARRGGDSVPAVMSTTPGAVSLTSPSPPSHSAHRLCTFSPAPFPGHVGGGGGFRQSVIPLSVAAPRQDDQPQTVPCDVADTHRLLRKRERNRVAAQRCRQRKVEQIATLQDRVEELSRTKVELERTAEQLRRQVNLLQRHLNQHVSAGCQLTPRGALPAATFSACRL